MFFESVARTTLRSIQFIKTTFIQWTQYVDPVLCQCCASVCDAGTTLTHHRANVSSLPDIQRAKTALHLSSITWLSILVITNHTRVETVWTGAIIVLYGVTAYYTRLSAHSVSGCTVVVVIITVSVSCLNFYNHHSFSLQERFGDYLLRWLCEMLHETEDKESDALVSRQNLNTLHSWQHVDKTPDEMESRSKRDSPTPQYIGWPSITVITCSNLAGRCIFLAEGSESNASISYKTRRKRL